MLQCPSLRTLNDRSLVYVIVFHLYIRILWGIPSPGLEDHSLESNRVLVIVRVAYALTEIEYETWGESWVDTEKEAARCSMYMNVRLCCVCICNADVRADPQAAEFDVLVIEGLSVWAFAVCIGAVAYTRITSQHNADHGWDKDESGILQHKEPLRQAHRYSAYTKYPAPGEKDKNIERELNVILRTTSHERNRQRVFHRQRRRWESDISRLQISNY